MQSDNPSGLRGDVRRTQDVADDRGGFSAGAPDFLDVFFLDAADGDDGESYCGSDLPEHFHAPRGVAGGFRHRPEHRAEADVVGAAALSFFGLIDIVSRDADEFLSHDFSRGMKRQVLLSEMDAIGVAGECDIGAVVDDETAVTGPGQAASAAGELEEVP